MNMISNFFGSANLLDKIGKRIFTLYRRVTTNASSQEKRPISGQTDVPSSPRELSTSLLRAQFLLPALGNIEEFAYSASRTWLFTT